MAPLEPELSFDELVAIGRALDVYAAALTTLDGNLVDVADLMFSAAGAAQKLRSVRIASGMGTAVTIRVPAS